jgi:hypothetical protein
MVFATPAGPAETTASPFAATTPLAVGIAEVTSPAVGID